MSAPVSVAGRVAFDITRAPGRRARRLARERKLRRARAERMERERSRRRGRFARATERLLEAERAAGADCWCAIEPGMTVLELEALGDGCTPGGCPVLERVRRRVRGLGGGA